MGLTRADLAPTMPCCATVVPALLLLLLLAQSGVSQEGQKVKFGARVEQAKSKCSGRSAKCQFGFTFKERRVAGRGTSSLCSLARRRKKKKKRKVIGEYQALVKDCHPLRRPILKWGGRLGRGSGLIHVSVNRRTEHRWKRIDLRRLREPLGRVRLLLLLLLSRLM